MITPLWLVFGFSMGFALIGIIAFIREPRRLLSVALFLLSMMVALLAILLIAADSEKFGSWPIIIVCLLLFIPALGYPILTIFLFFNGISMIRKESRSLGNLLSLLLSFGFMALPFSLPMLISLGVPQPIAVSLSGLIVGISFYSVAVFMVFLCASWGYRIIHTKKQADYIIVLGSGLIGDRVPPLLAKRIDKAIEIAQSQTTMPVLIPSGGQGNDELLPEGVAMAQYMKAQGINEENILVEDRAKNTEENLQYSLELIPTPEPTLIVVTSSYHVFRTAILTRRLGIAATVRGAKTALYFAPSAFLREFAAICKQFAKPLAILPALWTLLLVVFIVLYYLNLAA